MTAAIRDAERFDWLNFAFDVSGCEQGIDAAQVAYTQTTFQRDFIEAYAEQFLGLSRDMPDDAFGSLLMHVNVGAARAMGPTADARPVLLVETQPGKGVLHLAGKSFFLVNGNHRMSQAYFEGADAIAVRTVALADSAPFLI